MCLYVPAAVVMVMMAVTAVPLSERHDKQRGNDSDAENGADNNQDLVRVFSQLRDRYRLLCLQ